MKLFKRKENFSPVQTASGIRNVHPFSDLSGYSPFTSCEFKLYDSLKEAIPVIDAAIKRQFVLLVGLRLYAKMKMLRLSLRSFSEALMSMVLVLELIFLFRAFWNSF